MRVFLSNARQVAPGFFHACPYVGEHRGSNITFVRQFGALFLTGNFKIKFTIANDVKDIFKLEVEFEFV